ncbi:MAG TPA: hypothetical protein VIK53_18045 [Verrucomicrobiae bacterium]
MKQTLQELKRHYRRWNIQSETDDAAVFNEFKNRILHNLESFLRPLFNLNRSYDKKFAYLFGCSIAKDWYAENRRQEFLNSYAFVTIQETGNIVELATALHCLFAAIKEDGEDWVIKNLTESILESVEFCPGAGLKLVVRKKSVTFYPAGAKLLDKAVVDDVLKWLDGYPKVAESFQKALALHLGGDSNSRRNLLDNLRFSLEQLLKMILKNEKSLENQKEILTGWLHEHGLQQQIINMYVALLFGPYAIYQNEAVKHAAKFGADEIEFIIYQTGTFMRLLLQLEQKDDK